MKKIALVAENLCKTYGKGNTIVHALNDVSLTLHAGEIAALLTGMQVKSRGVLGKRLKILMLRSPF